MKKIGTVVRRTAAMSRARNCGECSQLAAEPEKAIAARSALSRSAIRSVRGYVPA
jgi:hypothetical protein